MRPLSVTSALVVDPIPEIAMRGVDAGVCSHYIIELQVGIRRYIVARPLALSGRDVFAMAALATVYAPWGKVADAQAIYAELLARAARGYTKPTQLAIAAVAAGERERALALLREAYEIRDPNLNWAKYWPDFAPLREDPRFDEILVGMGLK